MAALTDAQRADCYFFCGWPQRFVQINTELEFALNAIVQKPEMQNLLGNALTDSPPGLLAQARNLHDVTSPSAYRRLKALKVGSIELSGPGELRELCRQGRRLVNAICGVLGVHRGEVDVFGPGTGTNDYSIGSVYGGRGATAGNWVGK